MTPSKQTRTLNEQQDVRLKQFKIAAATYALAFPLLFLAHFAALISWPYALASCALVLIINAVFFGLFTSGANLKFEDASLTHAQTSAGIFFVMFVAYGFDHDRSLVLIWCFVVLLFGVFRFKTREFVVTTLVILAGYAAVINLLMTFKPQTVNVYLEWFQWATLAMVLPAFAAIGGRISALRAKLAENNAELVTALSTIQVLANHDTLTGLPNRAMFNDNLQQAIARATRSSTQLALFFIDLDHFKQVNDTLGHPFGDSVLREASRRFSSLTRDGDTLARFGGDEFVLLVENLRDTSDVHAIAHKLQSVLEQRATIDSHEVNLSASIGVCMYPAHGDNAQTMLANADIAMYQAKSAGRKQYCVFSSGMSDQAAEKYQMETALRRALEEDRFRIHYQPKIDIASGRVTGVEALIRWEHPELGLVYPDRFIRLAEDTGLIIAIGRWTLKEVCERARAWDEMGLPPMIMSVNLSASQLMHADFVKDCAAALKAAGRKPELFEFEITESMVMQNPEHATKLMEELRAIGVRLAIDDFGTGYSSLAYLKQFPVHTLKVDQSFVRDLPHNRDDVAITRAVIAMAHSLKMNVIAEGVEREEQLALLTAEGCDEFQGFYCARALPENELIPFLKGRNSGHRGNVTSISAKHGG
ncbi:MAG: EAL domain-containing protein [Betaproteobacteria bacterium]|nr:EAL domain-containing protein [Betaproteobacteria bacterium]